jgi:hypothetical protein
VALVDTPMLAGLPVLIAEGVLSRCGEVVCACRSGATHAPTHMIIAASRSVMVNMKSLSAQHRVAALT